MRVMPVCEEKYELKLLAETFSCMGVKGRISPVDAVNTARARKLRRDFSNQGPREQEGRDGQPRGNPPELFETAPERGMRPMGYGGSAGKGVSIIAILPTIRTGIKNTQNRCIQRDREHRAYISGDVRAFAGWNGICRTGRQLAGS